MMVAVPFALPKGDASGIGARRCIAKNRWHQTKGAQILGQIADAWRNGETIPHTAMLAHIGAGKQAGP